MAKQTKAKRKVASTRYPKPKTGSVKQPAKTASQPDQSKTAASPRRLPASWRIAWLALQLLWRYRRIFGLLTIIYALLNVVAVHSVGSFNVSALHDDLSSSLKSGAGNLLGGLSVYSTLFSKAVANPSNASGAYQFFLVVLISLVTIWLLRQTLALRTDQTVPVKISLKAGFYQGVYPLVPFLLIILLIGVQLIPFLLGAGLYSLVVANGIALGFLEQAIFLIILLATAVASIFWLTRSVMALYIVTLPDMTPLRALRSTKELVRGRRLSIARKLLFLPVGLFIGAAVIMIPVILIWAPLAQWLFFALSMFGLIVVHAYLYTLYRELINE